VARLVFVPGPRLMTGSSMQPNVADERSFCANAQLSSFAYDSFRHPSKLIA
jgi:hypothetical protein